MSLQCKMIITALVICTLGCMQRERGPAYKRPGGGGAEPAPQIETPARTILQKYAVTVARDDWTFSDAGGKSTGKNGGQQISFVESDKLCAGSELASERGAVVVHCDDKTSTIRLEDGAIVKAEYVERTCEITDILSSLRPVD